MTAPSRPIAYVLAATNHGSMIVNRFDYHEREPGRSIGVGHQLLNESCFDPSEVDLALHLLTLRREAFGHGVVAIDGGANVGVHTVEWGRHMHGWGRVLAFEAQEFVFYALAGNVALNNCWNVTARWMALGETPGQIDVPEPDYLQPGSFGSLEIRNRTSTEFIGQEVSYEAGDCIATPMQSIDSLALDRLDFIKLDIEGMEIDALRGARATLERHRPIVQVEVMKTESAEVEEFLKSLGYRIVPTGMNYLAFHTTDPVLKQIRIAEPAARSPG